MPQSDLIFISIAAYRDPQLVPTVLDCTAKAAKPDRLRFGICSQRDEAEAPLPFRDDPRVRLLEVDWRESKGACWARAATMKLWEEESWFLQVDSHCRFAPGWDALLIEAARTTGSRKPILSTYASPFTPSENEVLRDEPMQIAFQAFSPGGIPQLKPVPLQSAPGDGRPVRARFLSAGFLFAHGAFVKEVPYDPDLYFMGEEIAMTVRAFTHGYDLFHPKDTVLWHDYLRTDSRKHWGDHTQADPALHFWAELDGKSKEKIQQLLLGEPVGSFGLGTERTLSEYEQYAGLSFRFRKAQQYTMRLGEPPNPKQAADWADSVYPWIARARFHRSLLPGGALEDPILWSLAIQDADGYELSRVDVAPEDLKVFQSTEEFLALVCEFSSEAAPKSWTVQPLTRSRGWLPKLQGPLSDDDFAVLLEEDESLPASSMPG